MNNLKELNIEDMIYEIRECQVMLDSDLANLFNYETKALNRQVNRNIERFPENYCFQLTDEEYHNLRCQNVTSSLENNYGGRRYNPYVFTEHGITMLAGILKSDKAIKMSLRIVDTFVRMRHYISNNLIRQKHINNLVLEHNTTLLEHENEIKLLQETFNKLEEKRKINEIYFDGQIYDAYSKIKDIFSEANEQLIIIDGYADKIILDIIKNINCKVILITKTKSLLSELDVKKYNEQYHNLEAIYDDTFHDRYFILDKKIVYHSGTSINRIGSKTFSINLLEDEIVINSLLDKTRQLMKGK